MMRDRIEFMEEASSLASGLAEEFIQNRLQGDVDAFGIGGQIRK